MKKINEEFICISCQRLVPLAEKTCRNHCPYCFCSLHVDGDIPGDRNAKCGGKMRPKMYEIRNSEMKILFVCELCGKKHWNKRAEDDDMDQLIKVVTINKDII